MIITVGGHHGAGRTTTAKMLAERLGLGYLGIGQIIRDLAAKKGMTIEEFVKHMEHNPATDKEVDNLQARRAGEGNVVVDSNLGAHFVPNADFRVWVTAPERVRAERIFKKPREGDSEYKSVEDVERHLKERDKSDRKRYKRLYHIDLFDFSKYDLVIDNEDLDPGQVVEKIMKAMEEK